MDQSKYELLLSPKKRDAYDRASKLEKVEMVDHYCGPEAEALLDCFSREARINYHGCWRLQVGFQVCKMSLQCAEEMSACMAKVEEDPEANLYKTEGYARSEYRNAYERCIHERAVKECKERRRMELIGVPIIVPDARVSED